MFDTPNILTAKFPSHMVSNEEKKSKKWLLDYAAAMHRQYSNKFEQHRKQMQVNRTYAKGKQNTSKYKSSLNKDSATEGFYNLDWTPLKIAPKFVNILEGALIKMGHRISTRSIDPIGIEARMKYEHKMRTMMYMQKQLQDSAVWASIAGEEVPQSDEDIELRMSLSYKQAIEIAIEKGITKIFDHNEWTETKKGVIRNFAVEDIVGVKVYVDNGHMVKIRKCNPMNIIYGECTKPDFSDSPHWGELVFLTIGELKLYNTKSELTDTDWKELAMNHAGRWGNTNTTFPMINEGYISSYTGWQNEWDSIRIPVLDFEVKTTFKDVYEKKYNRFGTYTYQERGYDYKAPANSKYNRERVDVDYGVILKGMWPVGSKHLLNYGVGDFIARGDEADGKYGEAIPSFVFYSPSVSDGEYELSSIIERMIPHLDQLQLSHLAIQNIIAQARPKGLRVNIVALTNAAKEMGFVGGAMGILKFFNATGIIPYVPAHVDDAVLDQNPVMELDNGIGKDVVVHLQLIEKELMMIEKVTGINDIFAAQTPDPNMLVGVAEMANSASVTALLPIITGYKSVINRTARITAKKLQQVVYYAAKNGRPISQYLEGLGQMNLDAIELSMEFMKAEFQFTIEDIPDTQEQAFLEQNIQMALQQSQVTIAQAMKIRRLAKDNIKEAEAQLALEIQKTQKAAQESQVAQMQANAQIQQQSTQMATEAKVAEIQAKHQADMELETLKFRLQKDLESHKHRLDLGGRKVDAAHKRSEIAQQGEIDKELHEADEENRRKKEMATAE